MRGRSHRRTQESSQGRVIVCWEPHGLIRQKLCSGDVEGSESDKISLAYIEFLKGRRLPNSTTLQLSIVILSVVLTSHGPWMDFLIHPSVTVHLRSGEVTPASVMGTLQWVKVGSCCVSF